MPQNLVSSFDEPALHNLTLQYIQKPALSNTSTVKMFPGRPSPREKRGSVGKENLFSLFCV